jgi:hypothetical protein
MTRSNPRPNPNWIFEALASSAETVLAGDIDSAQLTRFGIGAAKSGSVLAMNATQASVSQYAFIFFGALY